MFFIVFLLWKKLFPSFEKGYLLEVLKHVDGVSRGANSTCSLASSNGFPTGHFAIQLSTDLENSQNVLGFASESMTKYQKHLP